MKPPPTYASCDPSFEKGGMKSKMKLGARHVNERTFIRFIEWSPMCDIMAVCSEDTHSTYS